jgi:hypothetical protein
LCGWWLLLSSFQSPRHLLIAVFPILLGMLLLAWAVKGKYRILAGALFCATAAAAVHNAYSTFGWFIHDLRFGRQKSPALTAAIETAQFLDRLTQKPNVVLLGCGSEPSPDLDYLMKGVGNVRNCLGWRNPDPGRNEVYLLYWRSWSDMGTVMPSVQRLCREVIYEHPMVTGYSYRVAKCPPGLSRIDGP